MNNESIRKEIRAMRCVLLAALGLYLASAAQAQAPNCKAVAAEKKLAGAAQASFMKKCESDAAIICNLSASERKLTGAARSSFTSKCVKDRVGG